MTADPHRAALMASLTWGDTFEAELHIVEDSLADCHAVMAGIIKRLKLPRTKSRRRDLHVLIHHAQASTFELEARDTHREVMTTHAHGLAYALCAGTPKLFGMSDSDTAAVPVGPQATPEPATPAAQFAYTPRPYRRRTPRYAEVMPSDSVLHAQFGGSACRF